MTIATEPNPAALSPDDPGVRDANKKAKKDAWLRRGPLLPALAFTIVITQIPFVLTVIFSLIFMMPIFRGLLFVILIFLVFMSIMSFVSRSDISKWPILGEGSPVQAGD